MSVLSALAALACVVTGQSAAPQFRARDVFVGHDTVWFVDTLPDRMRPVPAIAYARGSGRWAFGACTRESVASMLAARPHRPNSDRDTPLPDGFRLRWLPPATDRRYRGHHHEAGLGEHEVPRAELVAADGWRRELRLTLPPAARAALDRARAPDEPPFGTTPFSGDVAWWAAAPGRLFFALQYGHVPFNRNVEMIDDDELLAGVLMLDLARRRLVPLVHPRLLRAGITGMEVAGGALWVAMSPADFRSPYLARVQPDSGAWRLFGNEDSTLTLGGVAAIAAAGDSLWIAGNDGVAALDTRTMRADVRFYRDTSYLLADGADTLVSVLEARRAARPAPDTVTEASSGIWQLASSLGLRHHTAFAAAASRLRAEPFAEFESSYENATDGRPENEADPFHNQREEALTALADSSLVPFLREAMMLHAGAPQEVAGAALRRLGGDTLFRRTLAAVLDSGTVEAAAGAADTFREIDDPRGLAWFRRALRDPRIVADTELLRPDHFDERPLDLAVAAIVRTRETADARELIAVLRTPFAHRHPQALTKVVDALRNFPETGTGHDPVTRKLLILALAEHPRWWRTMLWLVEDDVVPRTDPGIRAAVTRVVTQALATDEAHWRPVIAEPPMDERDSLRSVVEAALMASYRIDPRPLVGSLVASFALDMPVAGRRHERLIELTGAVDAPAAPRGSADARRLYGFWSGWWRAHAATFTPLTFEQGEAALRTWRSRQPASPGRR